MTAAEYRKAVKRAKRILGYVQLTDTRRGKVKLSKRAAIRLTACHDGEAGAVWADESRTILLVGGY